MDQRDTTTAARRGPSKATPRKGRWLLAAGVVALVVAGVAAVTAFNGKSHSRHVTQQEYSGSQWPFTVPAVDLQCKDGKTLLRINGTDYALNDAARNAGYPGNFGSYWIDDPSTPGAKLPIYQLIMQADSLC